MFRLKANKTSIYKLVAEYVDLPPMRKTEFIKHYRAPDYALDWTAPTMTGHAFFSTCLGRPLLAIEFKDHESGRTVNRTTYNLTVAGLRERGMVEEFTTAAERRRIERGAENGGISPVP